MLSKSNSAKLDRAMAAADRAMAEIDRDLASANRAGTGPHSAAAFRARQAIAECRSQLAIEEAFMAQSETVAETAIRFGRVAEAKKAKTEFDAARDRAAVAEQTVRELEGLYRELTGDAAS